MAANVLIDTGAILALLDGRDQWHSICIATVEQLKLPLMTSEAVLTEAFHLIGRSRNDLQVTWRFIRSGSIVLANIAHSELPALDILMSRYSDRPMDFADATLVHLANRERISTVFTIDHRDFQTYRMDGGRRFRVLPPPPVSS
jgi:predicted nucleic acid-binding protein